MENIPLKLLIVEDAEDDLMLLLRTLRKGGYAVTYENVQTADDLKKALTQENWEGVISDYSMPEFSGIEALEIVRQLNYDLPFIIVSGAIGEEIAVQAMRNGAHDYMMKDNLARLVPSLQRGLQEAETRTAQKQREREVEAIATIASALRSVEKPQAMLLNLHEQILKLVNVSGTAFALRDDNEDIMRIELGGGEWLNWKGLSVPKESGIMGHVIKTYKPYITTDLEAEEKFLHKGISPTLSCAVCIPLIAADQVIGAVWLGRTKPFTQNEVRIVMAISEIAASALHRARILETLEQRVEERTAELQSKNEQLKELDVLKSKFVSDVSHELRTPITSLSLYLELLEGTTSVLKHDEFVDILKGQAKRLAQLVNNILDLSRLEAKPDELSFETVNLNKLTSEVITDLIPIAETRKLTIKFLPAPTLPALLGDYNKLTEVVTNLVSNAINYTPQGAITIRTDHNAETNHIEISVQDTGLGIAPEDVEHLFDRFYRGSTVGQLSIPGSGLGLAIVKEIVHLHRGTIDVESALQKGSTFTVKLPLPAIQH